MHMQGQVGERERGGRCESLYVCVHEFMIMCVWVLDMCLHVGVSMGVCMYACDVCKCLRIAVYDSVQVHKLSV